MSLFRTKTVTESSTPTSSLRRCLTAFDLTLLGIGAIIGAGVFVLTGVAAATHAGPAVSISYVLAGSACLFSALAYAELAASVPGCGSAYTYSYVAFGELAAWIIGWALLLEYTMAISSVAIGWSGYVRDLLQSFHIHLPTALVNNPFEGGWINLPAVLIILALAGLLAIGVKASTRFNAIIVFLKLVAIAIFITVAIGNIKTENWHPFFPFGWTGVIQGAAIVFFAYVGFDAVSTAAEEAINPQRDLPIGILLSVVICTTVYVIVAILLTGIAHYSTLNVTSPVANSLLQIGHGVAAGFVAAGAIAGLTTVMLVMYFGLIRVFLAISRDGLLPHFFAHIHPTTHTPLRVILFSSVIIIFIAGFFPLGDTAALVNIGTLAAFTFVCGGVIIMRHKHPELPRPFRVPLSPMIPALGVIFCVYLMLHLPLITWIAFVTWLSIGLVIYFTYSRQHSLLAKEGARQPFQKK